MQKIGERIAEKTFEILQGTPEGVRYTDLVSRVWESDRSFNQKTIRAIVSGLYKQYPSRVYKPSRGLFRLTKYRDSETDEPKPELVPKQPKKLKEEEFYEPFADWLVNEVEECTKAISLGGSRFGPKWGTPDVIGKRVSMLSEIIQAPIEIVSAEVKSDTNQLVTAFGQACAYCLFSHKSYLVVSNEAPVDEITRLDALCQVFGIGFVLFDPKDPRNPKFEIRSRARYQKPDLFYTNRYMKLIEPELFA